MEEKYEKGEIPGDTVIRVTQVHLGGPDFGIESDPERMKTTITGGQGWPPEASSNGGVLPGLPSLTSFHRPVAYLASHNDTTTSYNPRPGDSVQSSKDIPPYRPYEMPPNRGKLRIKSNYMSHSQLAVASTAAPSTVLWDNAVLPAASQYPQYEAGFDKEVDLS
ncbi:hypothetical protein VTN49DRAFT_5419 [Thermomyces lanuginosus]|uniref:uncharacterized protein n=1 Tax=Thermomyces lanuginosus TaxID=5541 RepID=UPI003741F569